MSTIAGQYETDIERRAYRSIRSFVIDANFRMSRLIGKGNFGDVRLGEVSK